MGKNSKDARKEYPSYVSLKLIRYTEITEGKYFKNLAKYFNGKSVRCIGRIHESKFIATLIKHSKFH